MLKKRVHYELGKQTLKSKQIKHRIIGKRPHLLVAGLLLTVPGIILSSTANPPTQVSNNSQIIRQSEAVATNKTFLLSEEESKERLRNKPPVVIAVNPTPVPDVIPEVKQVEVPQQIAQVPAIVEALTAPAIESADYLAPLLALIGQAESGGNYNAYFKKSRNSETRFTDMTIDQVLQWQREYVDNGSASSAVGKYQIIQKTLRELTNKNSISHSEKFDEAMQDRLAVVLLEKRGLSKYIEKTMSREQFSTNLAKEWASLPSGSGQNPNASYYEKDGINKAGVTLDRLNGVLAQLLQ